MLLISGSRSASLALALSQKARDAIPYLLDPAALPPARVSTADGLIAAILFFVLQGVVIFIAGDAPKDIRIFNVAFAFTLAGAVTYCAMRYIFWRAKTQDVPTIIGESIGASIRWGLGGGALSAVLGSAYIYAVRHLDLWHGLASQPALELFGRAWLVGLTAVAAPLFEEFIFRGLIFGGLRRSIHAFPAICTSAAIFAIVHPPQSMLPVFALGICTAYAYNRTKSLLTPMLIHAIYNAVVIGYQLFM